MVASLKEADLHRFIRESYEVDRRLEPESVMRSLARSTQVFGKMLEKLATSHRVRKKELEYIARLGLVFWGLVEVAVPGSFANLLVRHWISVLYLCEVLLIAGGLMVYKPVLIFGLGALATTLLFHFVVLMLGDVMRGRRGLLWAVQVALSGVFVLALALGVTRILVPMSHPP